MKLLTKTEIEVVCAAIDLILRLDKQHEEENDVESSTKMLNQLFKCANPEDFSRFAQIVAGANDPDFRSPK